MAITLDSYERILANGLDAVSTLGFVSEVAFLVVEGVLLWLSNLGTEDRAAFTGALNDVELMLARSLVKTYYLARTETIRHMSGAQALRVINHAWTGSAHDRVASNWSSVASIVASVASSFVHSRVSGAGGENQVTSSFARDDFGSELVDARATLDKLVTFVRSFGFSGVVTFVDKADETPATSNSALSAAQLLYPILSSTHLLEMNGFGWIFFL